MARPVPKPDYSKAGAVRDAEFLAGRAAMRPASAAVRADEAQVAYAVDVSGTRGAALDAALLATVEDGKIIPVSIDEFDTRYGGGSGGGISASAAMVRGLGC